MKKTLIIIASLCVLLIVLLGGYVFLNSQHPCISSSNLSQPTDETEARFILEDGLIHIGNDVKMRCHTGNSISLITEADVKRLRDMGAEVKEQWFPTFAHDILGNVILATKRYEVNLPVYESTYVPDSLSSGHYIYTDRIVSHISKAVFLPAPADSEESIIGTDILENFVLEYMPDCKALCLRSSVPSGYNLLTNIDSSFFDEALLGNGNRYYVSLEVNNSPYRFFIDSGSEMTPVKLPSADFSGDSNSKDVVYHSPEGDVAAKLVDLVWLKIGNRASSRSALYADGAGEEYSINPLTFFIQDVVIDLKGGGIYLHPHATFAEAEEFGKPYYRR